MGLGESSRSPLPHIPVLHGTYASCYRQRHTERSSFQVKANTINVRPTASIM